MQCTDNPLNTDTQYNDKIHYNDNLTVTKPLLKRKQLVTNYVRILYLILKKHMFWIFARIASVG